MAAAMPCLGCCLALSGLNVVLLGYPHTSSSRRQCLLVERTRKGFRGVFGQLLAVLQAAHCQVLFVLVQVYSNTLLLLLSHKRVLVASCC